MRCPIALVVALLAPTSAQARDAALVALTDEIPTSEIGIPVDLRVDGVSALVVTVHAGHFWFIDLGSGERRRVPIAPPEGVSNLVVYGVDRLRKGHLVVSAGWVERDAGTRGGLFFLTDDGAVESRVSYGISIRSIAVSPSGRSIVASIQEPLEPLSEDGPSHPGFPSEFSIHRGTCSR